MKDPKRHETNEAAKEREHWEGRLKKAKAALDLIAEQREKWADLQSRRSRKCRRRTGTDKLIYEGGTKLIRGRRIPYC